MSRWGRAVRTLSLIFSRAIISLFILVAVALCANAQTDTVWSPGTTGNWSNATDWNNGVPNGDYNALISNGLPGTSTVSLDINATISNLSLDAGNVLNVLPGDTLTFQSSTGSLLNNSGTVILGSTGGISIGAGNSHNLTGGGTVLMSGPGSSISGTTGTEVLTNTNNVIVGAGTISNLSLNNNGTIISNGGTLTIASSPLASNTNLGNLVVNAGSTMVLEGGYQGPFGFSPAGHASVNDGGTLVFASNITNAYFGVSLSGSTSTTKLVLDHADFISPYSAGGSIALSDSSKNLITGTTGTETLSPLQLRGAGTIENVVLQLNNDSYIAASGVNPLIITPNGGIVGDGRLGASTGGTLIVNADVSLSLGRGFPANFFADANSTVIINGAVSNGGWLQVSQGATMTTGSFTNADVAIINVGGGTLSVNGVLTNSSTEQGFALGNPLGYGVYVKSGGVLNVGGDVVNSGGIGLNGNDVMSVAGNLKNSGVFDLASHDAVIVAGTLNNSATGSTTIQANGGSIIAGNLTNAGNLTLGANTAIFVNHDFTQTSTGTLTDVFGLFGGDHTPLFDVGGQADLDGTLDLSWIEGYTPVFGDTFFLMDYGCLSGQFAFVNGLDIGNGLEWELFYDPNDIRLVAERESVATPEPSSPMLLLLGLAGVIVYFKLRR